MQQARSAIGALAKRSPVLLAAITFSSRYMLGDYGTQKVIEGKSCIDVPRLSTFGVFGFLVGGGPMYYCQVSRSPVLLHHVALLLPLTSSFTFTHRFIHHSRVHCALPCYCPIVSLPTESPVSPQSHRVLCSGYSNSQACKKHDQQSGQVRDFHCSGYGCVHAFRLLSFVLWCSNFDQLARQAW